LRQLTQSEPKPKARSPPSTKDQVPETHLDSLNLGLYLPPVNLAIFVLLPTLAFAQSPGQTTPAEIVCPLSDSQTKNSVEAFSRIAHFMTHEPRCFNCHGGVNPYIEHTGPDPEDPNAPPSLTEHGGGKMSREHAKSADGTPIIDSGCDGCHSHMAAKTGGGESKWMTAPGFLSFVGKDAPTLCKQIRSASRDAKEFMGHLKDDNGGNNFGGTAFNGDRGLDRESYSESEVPTQKPSISHPDLLKFGQNWIDALGGEFKGDKSCGCEPVHYAIRVSTLNETNFGPVHRTSVMQPVDVRIAFEDDGAFSGDSAANFQAAGVVMPCSGQASSTLTFHVSGQAIETSDEHSMHFQLENSSPTISNGVVQCPMIGGVSTQNTTAEKMALPFDFKGEVGEAFDYHMPAIPGFTSTMHLEIVKQ
jgi:hypothetical protein